LAAARPILIVDDEDGIRESLEEIFRDEGYDVTTARSGAEALTALAADKLPSVVILDLLMPGISGNEVYDRMQKDARLAAVPVIVSTSAPERAPPGSLIMKKPIDIDRLLSVVKTFCAP